MSRGVYNGEPDETLDDVLARAARATRTRLEEAWKRANLLRFDREASLTVDVPLDGLDGWLDIRHRLNQVARVRAMKVTAISARLARVDLRYLGNPEQLASALANSGLALSREADLWVLRRQHETAGTEMVRDEAASPDASTPE